MNNNKQTPQYVCNKDYTNTRIMQLHIFMSSRVLDELVKVSTFSEEY